jgi:Flp pilus assembly protein TadD
MAVIADFREKPMPGVRGFLSLALMSCLITSAARSQALTADAEFAVGMSANEKGDVEAALQHLQRAVALDPKMIKAHFAVGTIADLWCENNVERRCELAIEEYKKVLELDASREDALKNLAYASYVIDRIDQAESYYRKALALDGNDPEVLGGLAAIDNQRSYRDEAAAKVEHKVPIGKALIYSPSCQEVRQRNLARVEQGIALLTRALQIRNNSTDLMGFLSLLHARRGEIQCDNPQGYKVDRNAARKWDRMRKETWKRKTDDRSLRKLPPAPPPAP